MDGIVGIRQRPELYLESLGSEGLLQGLTEVLGLCLEGVLRHFTSRIEVTLHADGSLAVFQDGYGLPVAEDSPGSPLPLAEVCLRGSASLIPASWGAHRQDAAIATALALSEWFEVTVRREHGWERQRFEKGYPVAAAPLPLPEGLPDQGSYFHWRPDPEIFPDTAWMPYQIQNLLRTHALLAPVLRITWKDDARRIHQEFHFPGGVADFVDLLNTGGHPLHPPVRIEHQAPWGVLSLAFQYCRPGLGVEPAAGRILSYVNHVPTTGGTHVEAVRAGLSAVFNQLAQELGILGADDADLPYADLATGLTVVVSVRLERTRLDVDMRSRLETPQLSEEMEAAVRGGIQHELDAAPGTRERVGQQLSSAYQHWRMG
jgi:DNA gyrase/topoisomerase IV subunit B